MGQSLLVKGCYLFDDVNEEMRDILVENGKIAQIGDLEANASERNGVNTLDARNMCVTPGLIDCHVHLILDGSEDIVGYVERFDVDAFYTTALKNVRATLESGVTAVRDMGCFGFTVPHLRDSVNEQERPHIISGGHMIAAQTGHVRKIAREIRQNGDAPATVVKEQKSGGADFIKVIASGGMLVKGSAPDRVELKSPIVQSLISAARKLNMETAIHAYDDASVRTAIRNRARSVEHGSFVSLATLRGMARSDVYLVPTLKAAYCILENKDCLPKHMLRKASQVLKATNTVVKNATQNGVRIAMGTDSGTPFNYHGDNSRELEYLVEAGLSNDKAIEAGTKTAARLMGIHDVGVVEVGQRADLVLMKRNPLEDVRYFRDVRHVIREGHVVI